MRHSKTVRNLQRSSRQVQIRAMPRPPPHLKLFPRNTMLNARPQSLRACFLRRKPCGKTLCKVLFTPAEGDLFAVKIFSRKRLPKRSMDWAIRPISTMSIPVPTSMRRNFLPAR